MHDADHAESTHRGRSRSGPVLRKAHYLESVVNQLSKPWPDNRIINIVCHGHSVPAGYFRTPEVHTFESYPHLLHLALKSCFPYALLNVIVTAVGGEDSECGATRFDRDVLPLRPDVVTIDYGLNDRRIGLKRAEAAWRGMIDRTIASGGKVILLTPSPELKLNPEEDPSDQLLLHTAQIRALARQYGIGLADTQAAFQAYCRNDGKLEDLMSQANHPNGVGHRLIARELLNWFRQVNARDGGHST